MTDYIRGKKAYTKWDTDTDNVDMDLSPDGPHPRVQVLPPSGWFSGTKGKVLQLLIVGFIFLVGLISGYLMRRGSHQGAQRATGAADGGCPVPGGVYSFKERYAELLLGSVDRENLDSWLRQAEKSGVAGAVLYHDPFDDPGDPPVLANGERLPGDAVERGSLKTYPGDPGTPYLPATEDVYMPPGSDSRLLDLPSIPVQPISYNDAQELLSGMSGSMAPLEWQGKLNITYNLGPGYSSGEDTQVQLSVHNILRRADIHNVIGVIMGNFEPGRYVIVGCHHDAWTKGGGDPGTGMAALMELVRLFGLLKKKGWTPGRTLVFASWDAEEFGMVGSTEWVQAGDIRAGNNSLYVMASPLLRQALKEASQLVPCQEGSRRDMSVYDVWKMRRPQDPNHTHSPPMQETLPLVA
ncbi:glutamate carboxypeptidase, putative [Ixodes scapularis]|uniref:Glutamate carboxypeptidase, putative n=1 Tax=Ixodes scapularis TaxID=6945 RepID=B7P458_IXOSC|nr:glutamate carboxypeptidase, putative [Ixodes scapularis]|eukprot:XP_002405328.1 glutamate carboxypeptidase, putative [Ixodes scapularis]